MRDGDSSLTAYVTLSLLECYDYAKDLFNTVILQIKISVG